jgi:Xaa-Pro aminopeptidase
MQTMHPTLLVGPADWDPRQLPREEFDERLAALWRDYPNASGAVVYGNSSSHAALAYFTNFTPKLEAALALIGRSGEARLLIGGSVNMVPAAKPLTFLDNLAPLREAAKAAAAWVSTLPAGDIVMIGGDAMPTDMHRAFAQTLGADRTIETADVALQARMAVKRQRELHALRAACATLDAAAQAVRKASQNDESVTDCILLAEHTALQRGAQDVRSLFSLDGGRTLRPFDLPVTEWRDPLQVYLAVRQSGYWADGFVRVAPAGNTLQAKIGGVLDAMVAAAKPGLSCRDLAKIVDAERGSFRLHPLADSVFGSSIGLALDERPILARDSNATLERGAVYSLRAGLLDEAGAGGISSAIIAVTAGGSDVLLRHGMQP